VFLSVGMVSYSEVAAQKPANRLDLARLTGDIKRSLLFARTMRLS
jgi:hypothetical protein